MIRRVLRDGWKVEDAEAEAMKIGLRESPHWNEFARKYIETHRPKASLPSHPLTFGVFTARFDPAGTFTLEGDGWPKVERHLEEPRLRSRAVDVGWTRRLRLVRASIATTLTANVFRSTSFQTMHAATDDSRSQHVDARR